MRRSSITSLIVCVLTAILLGFHYYLARRLVLDPELPEPWRSGLLLALGIAAVSLFLMPISARKLPRSWSHALAWPSYVWMGIGFWLVSFLGFSDLLLGMVGAVHADTLSPERATSISATRAMMVAGGAAIAGIVALHSAFSPPRHARVEIELERWPQALDGFRIVQISDIHIGKILRRRFAEHVVNRVNGLAPDLIAVTGDLADGDVRELADDVAPFGRLRASRGVYFVTGNHDHYSGVAGWVDKVGELGMRALRNERVEIREGETVFDLIGVDDYRGSVIGSDGRADLPRATDGRDDRRPAILLAHDPSTFLEASDLGIDLQISGHTHGGQIWPFGYIVRLAIPYVAGRYSRNGSQLYVSRGTGFWGPPMRLFAPSEITELVIRSAAQ